MRTENSNKRLTYQTEFDLAEFVNVKRANEFLHEKDMTEILRNDLLAAGRKGAAEALVLIEWSVWGDEYDNVVNDHGAVKLVTTALLPKSDKDFISDWVKGQCSDGIGESFEQRFPDEHYERAWWDTDENEDGDYEPMASFDYNTNEYKFKLGNVED